MPNRPYKSAHISLARDLRKNSAPAEKKLWMRLRDRQLNDLRFRRQQPFGEYIADFYCAEYRLVIELDGDSHSDRAAADAKRDEYMRGEGYRVLRFSNTDVFENFDGVLVQILKACGKA